MAEGTDRRPVAVVLGLSPTGLHVVRTLGTLGVRVIGVADGHQAGRASRYLSHVIDEPDSHRRLEAILAAAPAPGTAGTLRPVLLPTSDEHVDFVVTHAERLAGHFAFQPSYRDGLATQIMSKDSFYALCDHHGVAYPLLRETTRDGLATLAGDLDYPVMIKPARLHRLKDKMEGRKGWVARSAAAMPEVIAAIPPDSGTLLVQDIVPGPESAITLVCCHVDMTGQRRETFTARKLRQYPPGFGSASLVQSTPEPESERILAGFLGALGYRGIAAAEFKRDPRTGRLMIIEINVRPSLWFSVTAAADRDVVRATWRDLSGQPPVPERPQRDGVRWRYWAKDVWSARFYRRCPDFVLDAPDITAAGPSVATLWAVYDPRDPWPALAEMVNFARKAIRRFRPSRRASG